MTTYAYSQGVIVYQNRYDNPAEDTALAPIGGAVHSDNFQVTTLPSLSGYKPYLVSVTGRRGAIDPLTKHTTVGQMTFRILDLRTNADRRQSERWVTAFLGDSRGRNQLLGNKIYCWESFDAGTTKTPFFVGRIESTSLSDGGVCLTILAKDFSDDLNVDVFGGRPYSGISYASVPTVLPCGLSAQYAQVAAVSGMTGIVNPSTNTNNTAIRVITLDSASQARLDNVVTAALLAQFGNLLPSFSSGNTATVGVGMHAPPGPLRLRFSNAGAGITNKELQVISLSMKSRGAHYYVESVGVTALTKQDGSTADSSDPYYTAFSTGTVADASTLTGITLVLNQLPASLTGVKVYHFTKGRNFVQAGDQVTVSEGSPALVLGDVGPMDLLADLLDGKFGLLYSGDDSAIPSGKSQGDPRYKIYYDNAGSTAWDTLKNPATTGNAKLPTTRWILPASWKLYDFIEKQLGQPFGIGYRFEPALDGSSIPVSKFVPCDLRLPNSAALGSINTITDADLDRSTPVDWSQDRASAISDLTVSYYVDLINDTAAINALTDTIPAVSPQLLTPSKLDWPEKSLANSRAIAIGSRPMTIDCLGLRGTRDATDSLQSQATEALALANARQVVELYRAMFGSGAATIGFRARRTSNTSTLWQGQWVYFGGTMPPSAGINKRGDTRLVLITERNEDGPFITFAGIDAGAGAVCNVPTIGTPTQATGLTHQGLSVAITVNAQTDPVEIRYLIDTTVAVGSPPDNNDARWTFGLLVKASGTYTLRNLPSHTRAFVEARSVPAPQGSSTDLKLPSAWVQPSGTKYVDLATLSAPGSLTITSPIVNGTSVNAAWTIPAGYSGFKLGMTIGGVAMPILPAGSTGVNLDMYLAAGATVAFVVWFLDGLTGTGTTASANVTTPSPWGSGVTLATPTLSAA